MVRITIAKVHVVHSPSSDSRCHLRSPKLEVVLGSRNDPKCFHKAWLKVQDEPANFKSLQSLHLALRINLVSVYIAMGHRMTNNPNSCSVHDLLGITGTR